MTLPTQPIPVPEAPADLPVHVMLLPAEMIYRTDPSRMHVLGGVYSTFNAFFKALPPSGGLPVSAIKLYVRAQAHVVGTVRVDVCARILLVNDQAHDHGMMISTLVGDVTKEGSYCLEAFTTIPEWIIPPRPGVLIHADRKNVVVLRLEAYVDDRLASSTIITYGLEPVKQP